MIGFVYILVNEHMPGLFKIGCTERSPHERAHQLSGSGVPDKFEVLCFIEVAGHVQVERHLHSYMQACRVRPEREFFNDGLDDAVAWLWWHPRRLSFCDVPKSRHYGETMLYRPEFVSYFEGWDTVDFHLLPNPWPAPGTEVSS